jgi:hypothetical protein
VYDTAELQWPDNSDDERQRREERLKQLADIFACIFVGLTPEQQAKYMSVDVGQKAA